MKLIKPAFTREKFEGKSEVDQGKIFTVRLNDEERVNLDRAKQILRQPKDSSALKELAAIGLAVLQDTTTGVVLELVLKNERNNQRTGALVDPANVTQITPQM